MKPSRGYTLIEVLIATTIIIILISMLITVGKGAKDEARMIQCAANLKTWGMAIQLFARANGDALPQLASGGDPLYAWGDSLTQSALLADPTTYNLQLKQCFSPAHPKMASNSSSGEMYLYKYKLPRYMWETAEDMDNSDLLAGAGLPDEIVKDDPSADYVAQTGTWSTSTTAAAAHNNNIHYKVKIAGETDTATFKFSFPPNESKRYRCQVRAWLAKKSNRDYVTYIVNDAEGAHSFPVNQYSAAEEGVPHTFGDEFEFIAGNTYSIEMNDTNTLVGRAAVADAVFIKPLEEIGAAVTDKEGFELVGTWNEAGPDDNHYEHTESPPAYYAAVTPGPDNVARWWFVPSETKSRYVAAWWKEASNRASSVTYDVYRGTVKIKSYTVNQQQPGSKWVILSNDPVTFNGGVQHRIEVTTQASGGSYVIADAVCLVTYDYEDLERPMMGYLYLGHRGDLPGTKTGEWQLPYSLRRVDAAERTAIMVDFITPNRPEMSTHPKRGGHVLTLDNRVEMRKIDAVEPRWADDTDLQFYW